jgi:beta-lactam-binding protein with PASTA domain
MKRYFRIALTVLAMLAVMLFSAAITLRIALHGHEVTIPDFAGMTVSEASTSALNTGVDLNIENRFYSTSIPAGRVLSQSPAAGSRVRHGWQVRVTVSLGPQQVSIPSVVGQPVREASIDIRRNQLDLGTLAHIDAPGDPDMVLAQTPPPNAGVDQPRVNLLLSSASTSAASSFVLPSFLGLSAGAAYRAASDLGLHVSILGDTPPPAAAPVVPTTPGPNGTRINAAGEAVALPVNPPSAPVSGPVVAQSPESGYRANRGDNLRLTLGHSAPAPSPTQSAPTTPPVAIPH